MSAFPPPPILPGRRATLAGAAGLLAACATGVAPQTLAGLHRLSLVTAFDPLLTLRLYGFTVADNQLSTGSLDMGLGPAAASAVQAALAGRFEIVAVEHVPDLLAERQRASDIRANLADSVVAEALRPMVPKLSGDAVLLLTTGWGEVPTTAGGAGTARWYGAGLTQYPRSLNAEYNNAVARVAWRMMLFRLPDLQPLGRQDAWAPGDRVGAPWHALGFRWAYAETSLPLAQAAELTQACRAAVVQSVPETLGRLGLVSRAR